MITVLMPTYNCAAFISDAIKSILNQTYKDFEFLIIDDGSNDNTEEIISKFRDSRIRYIKKGNSGLADSLNIGLKKASFDLIARMDADDISHPQRFEKQLKYLRSHKVDILSCWCAFFYNRHVIFTIKAPIRHEEIKKGLLLYSYLPHSGCIYSKSKILEMGGYKGQVFEDYALWLKVMDMVEFANVPEVLIFQRFRKDSLSRTNIFEKQKSHYKVQQKYYDSLPQYFLFANLEESTEYRGWREFFFGNKKKAREIWSAHFSYLKNWKIVIAIIISFLPNELFIMWKEARIRYRISYIMKFFKKENIEIRKKLKIGLCDK